MYAGGGLHPGQAVKDLENDRRQLPRFPFTDRADPHTPSAPLWSICDRAAAVICHHRARAVHVALKASCVHIIAISRSTSVDQ